MMHSRNSCKTLKCPKCNWHYKYQETLEIHMREKHPETDQTCIYCVTKQSHPKLSRGESYMCGYKPYRYNHEIISRRQSTKCQIYCHQLWISLLKSIQIVWPCILFNCLIDKVFDLLFNYYSIPSWLKKLVHVFLDVISVIILQQPKGTSAFTCKVISILTTCKSYNKVITVLVPTQSLSRYKPYLLSPEKPPKSIVEILNLNIF